jgi:hypothetical protein
LEAIAFRADAWVEALVRHAPPSLRLLYTFTEGLPPRTQLALRARFTVVTSYPPSLLYGA